MEDDDDEFGDLYDDVLQPLSSIQNPNPTETLAPSSTGVYQIPIQNPSSDQKPIETLAPIADGDPNEDWLPDNWNDDSDDDNFPVENFKAKIEPEARVRVSASVEDGAKIRVSQEEKTEIGDLYRELVIPGLSTVPSSNNGDFRVSNSEDWDSDSEDDLQIVLNDNTHTPIGGERIEDDDDEDMVIVTGEDQHAMENHAWAEGDLQPSAVDGEIKEGSEAVKANGAVGIGGGQPRIGYSNHGLHPQHHSMFKYIRPGAAASGAPAVGTSGQIRPPSTMSSIAGRGRGDWRPAGIGGIPGAPKSFHSGFRPGWANNSSRAFGGGLDFTLPSYKTVFDIDIEIFEEKPWKHPGVDISDYFNFALDEDSWKEYSKQLDQLRLESTMQSKIRVYESGRSEQAYDPDLPPELAAATGHHDISADNINHVKIDNGQSDLSGHGRDASYFQSPFPTGRAIQVETGCGERLPSIDTRLPRPRDTAVVIEIALQDPIEDATIYNSAVAHPEKDIQGEELERVQDVEGDRRSESECYNRIPQTFNGYRREMGSRRIPHAPERDGSMLSPPESPLHYNPNSRLLSPVNSAGSFGAHRGGRLTDGASHRKYSSPISNHTKDDIPTRSAHENRPGDHHVERPGRSMETSYTSEQSPAIAAEMAGELSIEQKDGDDDGMLALDDGIELEEENSDLRISGDTPGDDSTIHSSKKQKLSSRVEQPAIRDSGEDDDLRATHSDNSIAKSGSSNQTWHESGDGEVQKVRLRRAGDLRRRHDDYGREGRREMDRMRMGISGREAMHHSYHRDWEPYSVHPVRGRSESFERPRETDRPFWQRREDDIHSRRMDEDIRLERKIRVGDRNDKDDDAHLKKRLDDGDWRGRNREGGLKLRERDDVLHRRDNLDDHHAKRKKDEDHLRRERIEKEESSRRKRERDDNPNNRKREDSRRMREKAEEHHSSKLKDESWHQREREDRQRLKHPHEDPLLHRERTQGRGATRSGRTTDDKTLGGSGRNKSDSKVMVSDKDNQHRDKRHHKGREDAYAREKNYSNEERRSRHERSSVHSSRPNASDSQQISRERQREGTRRNKDTEIGTHNPTGLGKGKHEDRSAHHLEKETASLTETKPAKQIPVSSKGVNEQESSKLPHSSEKQGEKDLASDDEGQHESKRGRSKMERWTSHKEGEYNDSDIKDVEGATKDIIRTNEIIPTDELPRTEGNDVSDSDRHLDTVEKLKRRSERFKLPMPVDKDVASLSKRSENEVQLTQNEALADNEVKPERPARKRRWTTS